MGKGDKKTTRGKRVRGSYGKTRPRKKPRNGAAVVAEKPAEEVKKTTAKKAPAKKATTKKTVAKKPAAKKKTTKDEEE